MFAPMLDDRYDNAPMCNRYDAPMFNNRQPADVEPCIESNERDDAIEITVSAPRHFKLSRVSPSSRPGSGSLTFEGRLESTEMEFVTRRRTGIYSRKSPSFLIGALPGGTRFAAKDAGGRWIQLEDGSYVDDGSLALVRERTVPFTRHVHLPSNAVVAEATGHNLADGGLAVTVPKRVPAAKSQYVVVHGPRVAVRCVPSLSGGIVGSRNQGEVVVGEVSSGWLRLADGSGWMLIDGRSLGLGALLSPVRSSKPPPPMQRAVPVTSHKPTRNVPNVDRANSTARSSNPVPATSAAATSVNQKAADQQQAHRRTSGGAGKGGMHSSVLHREEPVLVECMPSLANVAKVQSYQVEEWEATEDGGFVRMG